MMRLLAGILMALAFAGAALAQPVDTGHLTAELVPQATGIAPGQTVHVALRQKIDKGWHTYWRNPGDSGEATRIVWTLPDGWTAGDIAWPPPHRQPIGPLMNYGYSDEVLLPVPVTAPASARPGETVTLKADATFLVCADICVPENAVLQLTLPVTAAPAPAGKWGAAVDKALASVPKPADLTAAFAKRGAGLQLAVTGAALKGADMADAYFFPFSATFINHATPQTIERGPEGLTLGLAPGYDFQSGPGPSEMGGVLSVGGRVYEVTARAGALPAGAAGLGPPPSAAAGSGGAAMSLLPAALFAFLGGLILNLMPCVFPILAMKAASLAGHAHEQAGARKQGLAFGLGVLVTFAVLAGMLVALQSAGAAVGWGFQLQSPVVVAALSLLILLVALNLSGVFEIGTSLQGAGGSLASRGGLAGAFFTGALAVVVAAPCTAPFMGPAVGWALTQPAPSTFLVFLALGLGFALPFVAVAFAPGLIGRLPKPGPWMDVFKKGLAFPMYGAAAWLLWVVAQQADAAFLARVLAAAILVAAAAWIAGAAQRGHAAGRRHVPQAVTAVVLAAVALAAAFWPVSEPRLQAEPYSAERLAALQAEGRPVFVNYTAAWCVSCQVNERVALSTPGVAAAFARHKVAYLKADWTRKDDAIAADLARHGRAGVPLYLVYGAGGGEYHILPNILTESMVVEAVEKAVGGRPS